MAWGLANYRLERKNCQGRDPSEANSLDSSRAEGVLWPLPNLMSRIRLPLSKRAGARKGQGPASNLPARSGEDLRWGYPLASWEQFSRFPIDLSEI